MHAADSEPPPAAPSTPATAQSSTATTTLPLEQVVVSASRSAQRVFDVPAAIESVDAATVREAGPQVNLSEAINRVPGVSALNRQNYSQDIQLSIRGFGARSTFGLRGVRLLIDGIPATTPDGQGQASTISLGSVDRIEVLKGPLAQLYGNAAGGVVQVFTRPGPAVPYGEIGFTAGSDGLRRWSLATGGQSGQVNYQLEATDTRADGYRDHSAVRRRQINTRWQIDLNDSSRLILVANLFDQPLAQDPLGLTRAQAQANPRQSVPASSTFNAGKTVSQNQLGGVFEHKIDGQQRITARLYGGQRDLYNWLSVPLANQQPATSSGGIVDFSRQYAGVGLQYQRDQSLGPAGQLQFTAGFDYDEMREARRGYINNNGAQGALKRDEINRVANTDFFAQASWLPNVDWTVTGGLRSSRVAFRSDDRFIVAGNPDDSGARTYSAVNPVLGVTRHVNDQLNVYANVGRGFETPTFTELAYRRDGSGPNLGLQAARSRHFEAGAKWRPAPAHSLDMALFSIRTTNELAVDLNTGGRTIYRNAGDSKREGAEFSYSGRLAPGWSTRVAMTWMRARLQSDDGPSRAIPGVSDRYLFAELAWRPSLSGQSGSGSEALGARGGQAARAGVESSGSIIVSGITVNAPVIALELVSSGRLFVDDQNSDAAAAYTLLNLRAGWSQRIGRWTLRQLVRVDNLTGRRYIGSVIVNEANGRFFEPGPGRTWMAGVNLSYAFD